MRSTRGVFGCVVERISLNHLWIVPYVLKMRSTTSEEAFGRIFELERPTCSLGGMMMKPRHRWALCMVLVAIAGLLSPLLERAEAYVEAAMSFGSVVSQSTNVLLMRVEAVD